MDEICKLSATCLLLSSAMDFTCANPQIKSAAFPPLAMELVKYAKGAFTHRSAIVTDILHTITNRLLLFITPF